MCQEGMVRMGFFTRSHPNPDPTPGEGLSRMDQSRAVLPGLPAGLGGAVGIAARRFPWISACPGAPMVRWLCLSVVLAVLIPAGWQLAPKDLEDLSRYGAGWSRAVGAAHLSPSLLLPQLSLFPFLWYGSKLPPAPHSPGRDIPS